MKPPASKNKRKANDGYEPLTFRNDDVKKMAAKEQGEDLLRILNRRSATKTGPATDDDTPADCQAT